MFKHVGLVSTALREGLTRLRWPLLSLCHADIARMHGLGDSLRIA